MLAEVPWLAAELHGTQVLPLTTGGFRVHRDLGLGFRVQRDSDLGFRV